MISFFLSCQLPPNSEGSAEPCEAIGASMRTQVRFVFSFLLQLAPSVSSADTLAKAKRGRLAVSILPFFYKNQVKF